tara:strand:+ start:271 stop:483 length:213 start_codon:yes stop_codon:yes gene_type:complete
MEQEAVEGDEKRQNQDKPDEGIQVALRTTVMKKVQQLGRYEFHCSRSGLRPIHCSIMKNVGDIYTISVRR